MEKTKETKKLTLQEILDYAQAKGLSGQALTKLEETYRELLIEDKQ